MKVKHKVHWPHEAIPGGTNWQHVLYDQPMFQWVQGFSPKHPSRKVSKKGLTNI